MDWREAELVTEEEFLSPLWLSQPRGFIDLRQKEAELFNEILYTHLLKDVVRWECTEEIGWVFQMEDLILDVESFAFEPVQVHVATWSMPRKYIDPLRCELRRIVSGPLESRKDMFGFATILLRLVEEAVSVVEEWKNQISRKNKVVEPNTSRGWNARDLDAMTAVQSLIENPLGLDISTVDKSGEALLGKSIGELCASFPEQYRILHIEPVFREDIVARFRYRRESIYEDLLKLPHNQLRQCVSKKKVPIGSSNTQEVLAQELCNPHVTFHGTARHNVSSIVRWGFVKPGQKAGQKEVNIACGASYGIGIYSSPDIEYATYYASSYVENNYTPSKTSPEDLPGLRIIICATIMGRPLSVTRDATRRTEGVAEKGAHSHVSPNMLEYVVFEPTQIIPCYVVHFDFGIESAKFALAKAPVDPNSFSPHTNPKLNKKAINELFPAEREELKQAKKAAAQKWFPYGFGPARGTKFVIQEIAETDDDEEIYGEWQATRKEVEGEVREWEGIMEGSGGGGGWFDEYQKSRIGWSKE